VDDDIDVFDATDVEWAVATRVQADRDVMIVSGARSKPLDPSLPPTPGRIPTTAKMGIDATISDDVPRERFQRIAYAYADEVRLADFLGEGPKSEAASVNTDQEIDALAGEIRGAIEAEPLYFSELAERFASHGFQAVSRAVGALHEAEELWQDPVGRYCLKGSAFAAEPPTG